MALSVPFVILCLALTTFCVADQNMKQIFDLWDSVVMAHVKPGVMENVSLNVVDYAGISQNPNFTAFISAIETVNATGFDRETVYAFYMNVYNALAIKMIIDHPCSSSCTPVKSIKDIKTLLHPVVWLRPAGVVAGRKMSLNDIEGFLRDPKPYKEDSRLHACIVCASISCPNVRREAFRPETVSKQMDDQVTNFLTNPNKGSRYDSANDVLTLSPIFNWFAGDFKQYGGVMPFLLEYLMRILPDDEAHEINNNPPALKYFNYNWNVNGAPPCKC